MSLDFKCRDWKGGEMFELTATAKAVRVTGCGTPGIYLTNTKDAMIPADEFCEIIRYFLTNYDLVEDDPRLKLITDLKAAHKVAGWEKGEKRISMKGSI
jgi:hypothetical protein